MKNARLLPHAALALGAALVSCSPYPPPGPPPGPFPLRDGVARDQRDFGRNFDRYGIPQEPEPEPMPDGIQDRDLSRYRQPTRPAPRRYEDEEPRSYERLDRADDPEPSGTEYPVAERSGTPGQVISPYAPYSKIDVTGFRSGQLAKDPKTGKIFQVP